MHCALAIGSAGLRHAGQLRNFRSFSVPQSPHGKLTLGSVSLRESNLFENAFREGLVELTTPPTVFYLNLTERCQLACAHCITHAPQTTAEGRARSLEPQMLEALAPHLAHARYVGFTHSGEPLLSPALVPFLQTLRAQRQAEPTVVHVITNGMAVTERRFVELCELGINVTVSCGPASTRRKTWRTHSGSPWSTTPAGTRCGSANPR